MLYAFPRYVSISIYTLSNKHDWILTLQRHAASADERGLMGLDRSVPPAGHFNYLASTRMPCDTRKSPTARASKSRRVQCDSHRGPEHVQHSDSSDSEIPTPRDNTSQAAFEAEACGGDRDEGSYTLNNPKGAMRFFGASSHFFIASPEGVGWLDNTKGNNMWRHAVQRNGSRWRLADWCSLPLPSKSETLELVHGYFETFNRAVPLFRPENLMMQVNRHYSWNPNEGSSWWAAFNIVLAFAYKQRAEGSGCSSDDWQKSIGHVRNAMNVVTKLFMRTCTSLSKGCSAWHFTFKGRRTLNLCSYFPLPLCACRILSGCTNPTLLVFRSPRSKNEKGVLDSVHFKRLCPSAGGPPWISGHPDFNTLLPCEDPHDGLGMTEIRGTKINFFSALARLAIIQRKACDTLNSTERFRKTREELMKDFGRNETLRVVTALIYRISCFVYNRAIINGYSSCFE
ncbi:hypothetical protein N7499_007266 [Penicillium canescens]|uniref:Uncharacterized protein n=1 Tax=Penicillium canescens TaxID=5083 RepID=A0AAD6IG90_PENCN|nr:uncharacterized protein N7446_002957 [Penicillium canescens]KAJ5996417.1 hypothetical protein N7522_008077 [Penicillium canescens]KAJ6044763.1 hypothetical protein N7460_006118 [Penicillium canescens]KAJ6056232.1 hypothetical protein N7444_005330 [Penicillium canescens]KAJ6075180.1 hypothetical protein N7446_002957 [Penicillium canescens]KAJ6082392.1 hypothetical protein N7499_007266 [Penicillium canescens]